jgi:hypothetical protein
MRFVQRLMRRGNSHLKGVPMKKIFLASIAAFAMAGSANAVTLVNATVSGATSGGVWDATNTTGFWTLFLQNPGLGDFLNPQDQNINFSLASGQNRFLLAGEGFLPGTNGDSDLTYNLLLNFAEGFTLSGTYTPTTNTFLAGSSTTIGNVTYSLEEFSYRRYLGDAVQAYSATPGGDGNDYAGNFRISAINAVPEPATWAMMIGGFGLVGFAARRRTTPTRVMA